MPKEEDEWQTVGKRNKNKNKCPQGGTSESSGGSYENNNGQGGISSCKLRDGKSSGRSGNSIASGKNDRPLPRDTKRLQSIKDVACGVVHWIKPSIEKKTSLPFDQTKAVIQAQYANISLNYFSVDNLKFPKKILHYDVTISRNSSCTKKTQSKLPQQIRQQVLTITICRLYEQYEKNHPGSQIGIVSDLSNNLYSTKDLAGNLLEYQIPLENDETGEVENFIVAIKRTALVVETSDLMSYASKNDGSWQGMNIPTTQKTQTEQVYNALIKSIPQCKFVPVGRSGLIWWPENDGFSLDNGVRAWQGVYANFSIGWNLNLNVDMTYGTFHKSGYSLDVIEELISSWKRSSRTTWNPSSSELFWINSTIQNCKVIYEVKDASSGIPHGLKKITGKVSGICKESAQDFKFLHSTDGKMSVSDYFCKTYGMKLKHPNGPCLLLNNGRSRVPAELCQFIKGKAYEKKLKDSQTCSLMKLARQEPRDLKLNIEKSLNEIMKPRQCKELKEFGISFNETLLNKQLRVLQPPKILYGEGTGQWKGKCATFTPKLGEWDIWEQKESFSFHVTKNMPKFGFLIVNRPKVNRTIISDFVQSLKVMSSKRGVEFENPNDFIIKTAEMSSKKDDASDNVEKLSKELKENFKDKKCRLVFVVIPSRNQEAYGQIKRAAEVVVGILTQCIHWDNVVERADEVLQNLVQKLNCKLGGTNHIPIITSNGLETIINEPILILGADVTHPPPNISRRGVINPSFAAVTGCFQKNIMPYTMQIRAQDKANRSAAEIIKNLDTIVVEMIQLFTKKSGCMPNKIMMFRDGVGEGQFKDVKDQELAAIKAACKTFKRENGRPYQPPITFITVQKRNKTRFFHHEGESNNNDMIVNAPAGTLMDTDIVHQTESDYYLLSHRGLLGTSCPTRYRVLHDESNFELETLKTFTYNLCYTFQRCNKSVRMPAPTYYAHYAATRAKMFSEGLDRLALSSMANLNHALMRNKEFIEEYPMHFI